MPRTATYLNHLAYYHDTRKFLQEAIEKHSHYRVTPILYILQDGYYKKAGCPSRLLELLIKDNFITDEELVSILRKVFAAFMESVEVIPESEKQEWLIYFDAKAAGIEKEPPQSDNWYCVYAIREFRWHKYPSLIPCCISYYPDDIVWQVISENCGV